MKIKMKLTIKMFHVLKPTSGRQVVQNNVYELAPVWTVLKNIYIDWWKLLEFKPGFATIIGF